MLPRIMTGVRWAFNFRQWSPSQEEWMFCSRCIQPEEKLRIGKFVFKKDAKSAMVGRLLLRKVISEYLHIPYKDIQLRRTEKGKPYILNESTGNFTFNLSHQGDFAVIAAETNDTVGIDVMKIEQRNVEDFFHTMRRQFTPEEWTIIKAPATDREKLKMFYRHWCLKESYVKALGIGIGFEIRRLNFNIPCKVLNESEVVTNTTVRVDGILDQHWTFEEQLLPDHCIAVAIKHDNIQTDSSNNCSRYQPNTERFKLLSYEELVQSAEPQSEPDLQYWQNFSVKSEDPSQMKTNKSKS